MSALDGVNGTLSDVNHFNQRSLSTEPSSLILTSSQSIGLAVSTLLSRLVTSLYMIIDIQAGTAEFKFL
jgi:hypothetical protein